MEFLNEFMQNYGIELISTALVALAGYLGMVVKKLVEKYLKNKTAKSIAKTVVQAVQQMYKDLNGPEKLDKAMEAFSDMLAEEGIHISEFKMRMLLEASVGEFKDVFKNTKVEEPLTLEGDDSADDVNTTEPLMEGEATAFSDEFAEGV
jgi:hypothetical protein